MRFTTISAVLIALLTSIVFADPQSKTTASEVYKNKVSGVVVIQQYDGKGGYYTCAGSIVKSNGYILTAKHCARYEDIKVKVYNSNVYKAKIAYIDSYDMDGLALLKIEPKEKLNVISIAHGAEIGEDLFIIGHQGKYPWNLTKGIISNLQRLNRAVLIQTDGSINPGNSGGPMLNSDGEIVAVVSYLSNPYGKFDIGLNYGYAPIGIEQYLNFYGN